MFRKPATLICDATRATRLSQAGDLHDFSGHHRYYGSSVSNGGERIVESRRGQPSRQLNVCGF